MHLVGVGARFGQIGPVALDLYARMDHLHIRYSLLDSTFRKRKHLRRIVIAHSAYPMSSITLGILQQSTDDIIGRRFFGRTVYLNALVFDRFLRAGSDRDNLFAG